MGRIDPYGLRRSKPNTDEPLTRGHSQQSCIPRDADATGRYRRLSYSTSRSIDRGDAQRVVQRTGAVKRDADETRRGARVGRRRILGCDRDRVRGGSHISTFHPVGRGDDTRSGPRRARESTVRAHRGGGFGTARSVRPERRAFSPCERVVGPVPPVAQPVAVAVARGGRGVGGRGRGTRRPHHRGDRRGVGRSRVRQRVPGRARRGGDALGDPPRCGNDAATARRSTSR